MTPSRQLEQIYRLMYEKLRNLQVEDMFDKALEDEKELTYVDKPDNFFFKRMVDLIFQSGVRGPVWKRYESEIRKEFADYNVKKVATYTEDDVERMMSNPKMFKNRMKIQACIYNAKEIVETSKRYGGFWKFIHNNTIDDLVKKIREWFKNFDYTNTYGFLRYVGVDVVKLDVNVMRILWCLGFIEDIKVNQKNIKKIQEVGKRMAEAVGVRIVEVDYVIYQYGAGEMGILQYSVCGKKPRCKECSLTNFCEFNKKKGNEK